MDVLERAHDATTHYAWAEAFEHYGAADAAAPLEPDDLSAMADAAWWIGKMRHCIALRERAHTGYMKAGDQRRAAKVATEIADHYTDLMEMHASEGWMQKASRLLAKLPEGPEHGWLEFVRAASLKFDPPSAAPHAAAAAEIGARHHDKDLFALGLAFHGVSLVFGDDPERGMAMVDEATVGSVNGELGPLATGIIYCMMITASSHVADWQRAGRWTEAAKRWCERQSINGFPGVCRVHRAEIMRLRGSLTDAEEEARTATTELSSFNLMFTALAFKELGEVRLRMGDTDAAEEALQQALEMGVMPQPGLALVQLQRGETQAATTALRRALGTPGLGALDRAKLLPAQVDIALAAGDLDTARAAATELEGIANAHASPALHANALASAAAIGLVDGDLGAAANAAAEAVHLFSETDLTYEAARTTLLLGQIRVAQKQVDVAQREISSALATFERIGAVPDADRARALLEGVGERIVRTFMFTEIVRNYGLVDELGDAKWAELVEWHDETIRKLIAEHGGDEISHAPEGFFAAFERPEDATGCAVAIQRALLEHGVAPDVRIGVHSASADAIHGRYHGTGVHETARIAAIASAGEILVSGPALGSMTTPPATENARDATLRGVAAPVAVSTLPWRTA